MIVVKNVLGKTRSIKLQKDDLIKLTSSQYNRKYYYEWSRAWVCTGISRGWKHLKRMVGMHFMYSSKSTILCTDALSEPGMGK